MANLKFELSFEQALIHAIHALNYGDIDEYPGKPAVIKRLQHELDVRKATRARKANAPKRESSTAKANAALLNAVLDILPNIGYDEEGKPQDGYNLAAITAKVPGIMSASKLGVVLRPAINDGTVIKYRGRLNGKTVTFYALA